MTINEVRSLAMNEARKANKENKFETWSECVAWGWRVAKFWHVPASKPGIEVIKENDEPVLISCEVIEFENSKVSIF